MLTIVLPVQEKAKPRKVEIKGVGSPAHGLIRGPGERRPRAPYRLPGPSQC